MKKKTKTKIVIAATVTAFFACFFFRPVDYANDTFFKEKFLNVPAKFIVSHDSPFTLMEMTDQLILEIPNNQVAKIHKVFTTQRDYLVDFKDTSKNLPRHYHDFTIGRKGFFPPLPPRFQAGSFTAFDGTKNNIGIPNAYYCHYMFVQHNADLTYLYLSSRSPIN